MLLKDSPCAVYPPYDHGLRIYSPVVYHACSFSIQPLDQFLNLEAVQWNAGLLEKDDWLAIIAGQKCLTKSVI